MGMFTMRKPRGFQHNYIYVNERKEKLDKMTENAKRLWQMKRSMLFFMKQASFLCQTARFCKATQASV